MLVVTGGFPLCLLLGCLVSHQHTVQIGNSWALGRKQDLEEGEQYEVLGKSRRSGGSLRAASTASLHTSFGGSFAILPTGAEWGKGGRVLLRLVFSFPGLSLSSCPALSCSRALPHAESEPVSSSVREPWGYRPSKRKWVTHPSHWEVSADSNSFLQGYL